MESRVEITIEEFYQIIGELEVLRRKQNFQLQALFNQINEMNQVLQEKQAVNVALTTQLEEANGRLVQTDNNK